MTCVVGVVGENGVLLAGDSQASSDRTIRMRRDPKVFQLCPTVALAYCGSARLGQILTYWLEDYLEEPFPPLMADERGWAVRVFVPALTDCLEAHGHLHRYEETSVVELGNSAFLLAVRSRLFNVEPDMQVGEDDFAFSALGSGEDVAMGAMHKAAGASTSALPAKELRDVALAGVEAASRLTPFVGGKLVSATTVRFTKEERKFAEEMLVP